MEEKKEVILNLYSCVNLKTNVFFNIGIGVSDNIYIDNFLNMLFSSLNNFVDKTYDLNLLIENLFNSKVVKIGSINLVSGEVSNIDNIDLLDFSKFNIIDFMNVFETRIDSKLRERLNNLIESEKKKNEV